MRLHELFEQYGKPVPFAIPKKIAAIKPRPDYRQTRKMAPYRVDSGPSHVPTINQPDTPKSQPKPQAAEKPMPIRVGKELIKPNDPRYASIMSLLARQQRQP